LDEWDFNSTLLTFFKGIESLLSNPNPANPYGTDSCTRAAEYFNKHPYKPPEIVQSANKAPRILGNTADPERPGPPGE
jgi:ubiquitin-protein ligase